MEVSPPYIHVVYMILSSLLPVVDAESNSCRCVYVTGQSLRKLRQYGYLISRRVHIFCQKTQLVYLSRQSPLVALHRSAQGWRLINTYHGEEFFVKSKALEPTEISGPWIAHDDHVVHIKFKCYTNLILPVALIIAVFVFVMSLLIILCYFMSNAARRAQAERAERRPRRDLDRAVYRPETQGVVFAHIQTTVPPPVLSPQTSVGRLPPHPPSYTEAVGGATTSPSGIPSMSPGANTRQSGLQSARPRTRNSAQQHPNSEQRASIQSDPPPYEE